MDTRTHARTHARTQARTHNIASSMAPKTSKDEWQWVVCLIETWNKGIIVFYFIQIVISLMTLSFRDQLTINIIMHYVVIVLVTKILQIEVLTYLHGIILSCWRMLLLRDTGPLSRGVMFEWCLFQLWTDWQTAAGTWTPGRGQPPETGDNTTLLCSCVSQYHVTLHPAEEQWMDVLDCNILLITCRWSGSPRT